MLAQNTTDGYHEIGSLSFASWGGVTISEDATSKRHDDGSHEAAAAWLEATANEDGLAGRGDHLVRLHRHRQAHLAANFRARRR